MRLLEVGFSTASLCVKQGLGICYEPDTKDDCSIGSIIFQAKTFGRKA